MTQRIQPGATLGMLGGGQLGRMFVIEALRMGYFVWLLDPDPNSPAGAVATRHLANAYSDQSALDELAAQCAAITIEFENIPADSVRYLAARTRVTPSADCIEIAQDRQLEKEFAARHGLSTADYAVIASAQGIPDACRHTGFPSILKTARLGYDGKGQVTCHNVSDVEQAFTSVNEVVCVLEKRIDLAAEVSVVLARSDDDTVICFPVGENVHVNGILDTTRVPASLDQNTTATAITMAESLVRALDYVGVLAVEIFVDQQGKLLINEIAPRPHNSGHFTLDATVVSQFEQQVRALCAQPLGDTTLLSPVAMLNILGDSWFPDAPDWTKVHKTAGAKLHLYGKSEPRAGRKMGHINLLANTAADALDAALKLKTQL